MGILGVCIGVMCLLGQPESNRMTIEGVAGELKGDQIYLGRVLNEANGFFEAIDSAVIENGRFRFVVETVVPEVLFLGVGQGRGGVFFAEPGDIRVKPGKMKEGRVDWDVEGSTLDAKLRDYLRQSDSVRNQKGLDSLAELFYAAREREDREEMMRLKEESVQLNGKARNAEYRFVKEVIERNKDNELGMYLYYNKVFLRMSFLRLAGIEKEREYINSFGARALASVYKSRCEQHLDQLAGCAIGAVAPEITGQDTLGKPIKLSDFRGKYVIVDFWDSYCQWCRKETPWLKKAQETFKDKNFTILGVSDDRKRELWLKAIREDGSYWNHLLLDPKDKIFKTYGIREIPHIILVGPDGRILAKEIRQQELTEVPAEFMGL